MTEQLQKTIDAAWENRAKLSPQSAPKEVVDAVEKKQPNRQVVG